jgi:hypothetical protein
VTQAQTELGKLTSDTHTSTSSEENTVSASETDTAEYSLEAESSLSSSAVTERGQSPPAAPNLFSRLQSALPPNVVSTVQSNLPESLKQVDFNQLRTTWSNEFQRVQGVTRAQAEEYVHKSEALLREAVKEAGEVLKDVVKVVPPDESIGPTGVVWDGTDMWMMPSDWNGSNFKGKEKENGSSADRTSGEAQRAVATRAESLRKRLKHDPEIIKLDPAADEVVKATYEAWVKEEVATKEGGIEGKYWKTKATDVLSEPMDGQALRATQDTLGESECP